MGGPSRKRLHQISSATLTIRQGSLYPVLHRLERRGWIKAHKGTSDSNHRAKYYELTKRGRVQLETEIAAWRRLSAAMGAGALNCDAGGAVAGTALVEVLFV